jgi:sec-independent protein translocase protein TatC
MNHARGEMTFMEHLGELRRVLWHALVACVLAGVVGWMLAPLIMETLIQRTVRHVILLTPLEGFNERLKLAFILGVLLASPYVLYRVWSFVVPGLLKRERSLVLPIALGSWVLFMTGAWVSYEVVTPIVLHTLGAFVTPSMQLSIQLGALLSFIYNMSIACGVVFQLPLVLAGLTAVGLVTPGALARQWRYAIVGTLFVTAAVTPGDVVSAQIVLGIPMVALYFVSVGLSWLVARARGRRAAREATMEEETGHA